MRVAHPQPDHEAIELALRQDVGPLELVGVLGRQHDERRVEGIGLALDRDLAVAHRLEQGALGPRRRPVDLVGEDHVGEERALLEDELARGRVVDARAQDVRRQQVRSELDSPERTIDTGSHRPGQQGLAHAGHVLDQDMAFGQQRDHGEPDDVGLAQDHEADVVHQSIGESRAARLEGGGTVSVIWVAFMRCARTTVRLARRVLRDVPV